jgi:trk system potassium uptake protein TrkH
VNRHRSNFRIVARDVGALQVVLSAGMVVATFVSLLYGEWYSALGCGLSAAITAGLGGFTYRVCRDAGEPRSYHAMVIAGAGWMIASVFGALPFLLVAHLTPHEVAQEFVPPGETYSSSLENFQYPLHAWFDSMSCYTTTGLSMAVHEPSMGYGLNFYRMTAAWLGGAGMIVLSLAIIPRPGSAGGIHLFATETSAGRVRPSVVGTARAIWKVYVALTLALAVLLATATFIFVPDHGFTDTLFHSVSHAMSGLATAGVSPLDDSIATFNSHPLEIVHMVPIFIGMVSLPVLYLAIRDREARLLWGDVQFRLMVGVFAIGAPIMVLLLWNDPAVEQPIREGVFQFISAMSTTGWQISNVGEWHDSGVLWIVWAAMFSGGAAGSTVGGIKLIRSYIIFRAVSWRIKRVFLPPEAVVPFKVGERTVPAQEIQREIADAAVFVFLYLVFLVAAMIITSDFVETHFTLADIMFEAVAAQTGGGMSTGITHPRMSPVVEVTYILQMWIGRLEIFPVIILLRALFVWQPRHKH